MRYSKLIKIGVIALVVLLIPRRSSRKDLTTHPDSKDRPNRTDRLNHTDSNRKAP